MHFLRCNKHEYNKEKRTLPFSPHREKRQNIVADDTLIYDTDIGCMKNTFTVNIVLTSV